MRKISRVLLITISLFPGLPNWPTWASEYRLGMDMGASYNSHANYLDRGMLGLAGQLHFSDDHSYMRMRAEPFLHLTLVEGASACLQADADWQNSDDPAVDKELQVEWSNAYLALSRGGASAHLGLQTVTLGKGLIMTDDVPAAALNFNLGKAYLGLTLAQVLDSSPMAAATIGIRPGEYEHAALFGIWFQDRENAFARAMPLIYQVLLEPESDGELYWAGISLDLFVGKALLSVVGAYQWGQFRIYNNTLSVDRNVSAFLADLSLEGNLSDWCSLGVFVFFAQGDDTPLRGDLNAFVSVMPFNSRAAIFFDPEFLGRDEDAEDLTFSGGFFGGVIAPGLTLNLLSTSGLSLETTVAAFYADQALDDGSRWYGWEIDLGLSYTFGRFYTVYAEAARFQHGDYYESLLNEKVDAAIRFSLGLRATF